MQFTLDESLLQLTKEEKEFLHSAISEDDNVVRSRILQIQKR